MIKVFKQRMFSRILVLQGIYSFKISDNSLHDIENFLINGKNINKIDVIFFRKVFYNFKDKEISLNFFLENIIDKYTIISILENIIIKIALFEIFYLKELSFNIIINESINLSKKFCSKNSYMIINKILNIAVKGYIYNSNFFLKC